jgi:hypothetical protein
MRRNAVLFALLLLVAPLAARLAVASSDLETARCALACARAGLAGEKGAVCCPTGHGAAVPTISACHGDGDGVPLPGAYGPVLLVAALLLSLPSLSRRLSFGTRLVAPFPPARLLDKVPLLLA